MGRFYQTDKPTFVDNNILQLPYQLMANVIGKIDSDIAQNESQVMSLYDQLNANALKQDQPRLREILGGFETEIDDLSKEIQKSPLDFRRKTGDIRNLSRRLNEEFTRGEVAAIQGNFNAFQDFVKRGKESVKSGDTLQEDFEFAKRKFFTDFQGTDFQDGDFQSIFTEDLNKFIDVEDIAETRGKEYAASTAELINGYSDGVYIYEDASKEKIMPYEKVYSGVLSSLMNDRELNSYLTQQVRLGAMSPEEYQNTIIAAADRVANKFSFRDTKQSRKLKNDQIYLEELKQKHRKAFAKFKKELDDPAKFSLVGTRSSAMLDKKDFNHEGVQAFKTGLESELQRLKDTDVSNLDQEELRQHNYNMQTKQAALNRLNSIDNKAVQGTMRMMRDQGIITPEDYNNFLAYQDDKVNIDNQVIPILESINNEIDALQINVPQGLDRQNPGRLDSNAQKLILKQSALQQRIQEDPAFADAYSKYNAGRAPFAELNEGEKFQIVDGLAIEFEKPNKWLNQWYEQNADANTLYNSYITVDPKDEDSVNLLDDIAMAASSDAKVLSTTKNTFNPDGTINTQQINPEIDDTNMFGSNERFSISTLVTKTGKKPSQLFDIVGIEPSVNGTRVIYTYNEDKIQEAGIDEIEGLEDGQTFMMEYPGTGIESLITEKYSRNKNGRVVETAKAFSDPVYMHVSNEVDNTIKDITASNFEEGPENNIFVDGLQLKLTARNNPNGGFLYTLSGTDSSNGKEFNIPNIRTSDKVKLYIKNYLDVRNSGKLR